MPARVWSTGIATLSWIGIPFWWSVIRYATHSFLPFDGVLVAAVVIGAVAAAALAPWVAAGRGWVGPAVLAAGAVGLALAAPGYVSRHAGVNEFDAGVIRWFESQPGWRSGHRPLAVSPTVFAPLAGSRLHHRLRLIEANDSCATIARKMRGGYAVVGQASPQLYPPLSVGRCLAGREPAAALGVFRIYSSP